MALLDVSLDTLFDPMFLDSFVVNRRQEIVGNNGRSTLNVVQSNQQGVVASISPNDLVRRDDYQIGMRGITVVTAFQLQMVVQGYQPDVVTWRGDNYIVKHIDYYPQFGTGFYQAECMSIDKVDVVPSPNSDNL